MEHIPLRGHECRIYVVVVVSSYSVVSDSLRPYELQHAWLPCPSLSSRVCSNSLSIELVMPFNHLIFYCPLLLLPSIFSSIRVFSIESALHIRWPKCWSFSSTGASVLPMNIQGWFSLGLTGFIPLLSKGLSRIFSIPQFEGINSLALSLLCCPTLTSVHDCWKNHSSDNMDLCQQSDVFF